MWQAIGIICAAALVFGLFVLVHGAWVERQEQNDDAIVRALSSDPYEVLQREREKIHTPPCEDHACAPAVYRSGRPWAWGGNAHQRRIFKRAAI